MATRQLETPTKKEKFKQELKYWKKNMKPLKNKIIACLGMLILGTTLIGTATAAKYDTTFSVNPSSKTCTIPQSSSDGTCNFTFTWTTRADDYGTASPFRELYIGGTAVLSGYTGTFSHTATIPIGTVNYNLAYSSYNGSVTVIREDYIPLFSHSSSTHNTITGDFNGDGEFENYFQPKTKGSIGGLMPVVSNDFLDSSIHKSWTTSHPQISAIQDWSEESYAAFSGNFNSNPGDELLLLGTKQIILLHGDIITPITIFQPVDNAIVSWNSSHVASHSEFAFDANPADFVVHIGDLTGDSYDEIFLQGKSKGSTSYILSRTGTLIQTITNGYRNMDWSAASYSINLTGGNIVLTALTTADDDNVAYTNSSGVITSLQTAVTKPTISSASQKYVFEGQYYSFIPTYNSSASSVTFSASGKPAWLNLNASTGELSGTPSLSDTNKSHTIVLTIKENKSHTVSVSKTINIEVAESFQISQTGYTVYQTADGTLYLVSDNGVDVYKIVDDNEGSVVLKSSMAEFSEANATLLDGYRVQNVDYNGDGNTDLLISPPLNSEMETYVINDINSLYHNVTYSTPGPLLIETPERDLVSDAIGAISGSFNVDEGGQANYSIPIYTPVGVAGVTPSLSLNYNSGAGNGIAGVGWNIGGLSAISRCPKSLLINGERGSVNLDSNDRFCLDGQRLVLVSGVYGEPGSEYRTYPDSKTKVTAIGTAGDGPKYFKVWRSDGSYNQYGSQESSRLRANDGSDNIRDVVASWSLSYSEDRYTNRIFYYYDKDETTTSSYLERVSYAAGQVEISFQYESRPDQRVGYFQGGKTALLERLRSIQVNDQNKEVRLYDLAYELSDSEQSRLVSITESKDGVSLQPTTFDWSDAEKGIVKDNDYNRTSISFSAIGMKNINLDDDFIPESYILHASGRRLGLNLFEYAGAGISMTYQNLCAQYTPDFEALHLGISSDIFPFDLNGNGVDDLLVVVYELKSISSEKKQITWYDEENNITYDVYDYETVWDLNLYAIFNDNACSGNINAQFLASIETGAVGYGDPRDFLSLNSVSGLKIDDIYFGDIDGDHLPDLVYEKDDKAFVRYHLVDSATSINSFSDEVQLLALDINNNEVSIDKVSNNRSADFNADGRLDILLRSNGVWSLYLASTSNNGDVIFKEHVVLGELGGHKKPNFQIVDINSDGLSDLAYIDASEGEWQYSLYTGKEFVGPFTTHVNKGKSIWFLDHNENGKKEVVYVQGARVKYSEYVFNNSIGFFPSSSNNLGGGDGLIGDFIALVDLNGDGSIDIHSVEIKQHTLKSDDYENYVNINKTPFEIRDRITAIGNGLGNITNVDYRLLTDPEAAELYEANTGWYIENGYVVHRQHGHMAVVEQVESSAPSHTDADNKNGISYRYGNYKTHVMYGGLGFEWLETTDLQTGIITRTTYHQTFPHIGQPQKTEVW